MLLFTRALRPFLTINLGNRKNLFFLRKTFSNVMIRALNLKFALLYVTNIKTVEKRYDDGI